jgi:hypothetical protein
MADGFKPVAIGITQKGRIVAGVIVAQARRPVIAPAMRDTGMPERIDR